VVAATAADAEVWATAALVAATAAREVVEAADGPVAALLVPLDGEPELVGAMGVYLR
jgi:hypothetical protein